MCWNLDEEKMSRAAAFITEYAVVAVPVCVETVVCLWL